MAKPIITLNGLKIVIMLGMLVIILTGVRFAAGEAALAENAEPLLRCASASTFLICEIAEIA